MGANKKTNRALEAYDVYTIQRVINVLIIEGNEIIFPRERLKGKKKSGVK